MLSFATTIDELLRRPLVESHIRQLNAIKDKLKNGGLSYADENYVREAWEQFQFLSTDHVQNTANASAGEKRIEGSTRGIAADLELAKGTIEKLREAAKTAIAHRDEWATRASELEQELADLRQRAVGDRKFEQTKRGFAKLYHPNSTAGGSSLDATVRAEVFKEYWVELERIEAEGSAHI